MRSIAFDDAVVRFAADMRAFYGRHESASEIFADVGQFAIVASIATFPDRLTEAQLCKVLSAGSLASRRRVRAHLARLQGAGLVQILRDPSDLRARLIAPCARLEDLLDQWVRALAGAGLQVLGLDAALLQRQHLARFYLAQVMAAHRAGYSAFTATPNITRLTNLSRGHALVLELLSAASVTGDLEFEFSRRGFAQHYGVSRTHVIDLLGECENLGLVAVRGRRVALSDGFRAEARLWVGVNFVLAAAALEGRLLLAMER